MAEILTIGEPLVVLASSQMDVPLTEAKHFDRYLGGAELNVATGIRRLGHSVAYVAQVGTDPFGQFIQREIAARQIETQYVTSDANHWTGHQIKDLVSKGDPAVFNFRTDSASSHFDTDKIAAVDLAGVKYVHLTGIFPSLSVNSKAAFEKLLAKAQEKGVSICFDTNLRPDLWPDQETMVQQINAYAAQAQIVLPGVGEGEILTGSRDPEKIADFYLQSDKTELVVVKVGAKGAFLKTAAGVATFVPGYQVAEVKDTIGAGDGFAVGLLTALVEGRPYRDAVKRGNAIGALQVQVYGDNEGYPTQQGLADFFAQARPNF